MVSGKTKRIVVIKDIDSNIVEEAILILKSDQEIGEDGEAEKKTTAKEKMDNDFLLKEAQLIISNYIKECRMKAEIRMKKESAGEKLKRMLSTNIFINLAMLGAFLLLVFLITELI